MQVLVDQGKKINEEWVCCSDLIGSVERTSGVKGVRRVER